MTILVDANQIAISHLMIRNKITQDILKKAGHPTPREAFAVLSVNGEYFGEVAIFTHMGRCTATITAQPQHSHSPVPPPCMVCLPLPTCCKTPTCSS